jgi:hypothetical protein
VRVSNWIVRPGRKNGGTMLVFTLARRALVRFTIVRVYPSCKHVGSFSVRAHGGLNRVRFQGRFRGRPLPAGTYRLLVHARGHARAAAAVTIVVARRQSSRPALRRARSANSCSPAEAREIETALGLAAGGRNEGSSNPAVPAKGKGASLIRVASAVKGVMKKASLSGTPFSDPILFAIGLLTLLSACLGTFVLLRGSRTTRWRLLR